MQLALIFGIAFAIGAVVFALQSNTAVSVSFVLWRFDSSLAVVLLLAVGVGALIAGLVSSPAMIRGQLAAGRLRRQATEAEQRKLALERRVGELEALLAKQGTTPPPAPEPPKPYVGMVDLLATKPADPRA